MIYSSALNSFNEGEINELLENAEDRFEYETIAEATAKTIAEQEENWTRFMKGIGFSELNSIMEGEEVIYEGARLKSFISKAKAYFKMALNKLAEITKSFIAKVDSLIKGNDAFLKKYESKIRKATLPDDFSMKGYPFAKEITEPAYNQSIGRSDPKGNPNEIINNEKGKYSKEEAEKDALGGTDVKGDTFNEKLMNKFYGSTEKEELTKSNINLNDQIDIIRDTKNMKSESRKSYKLAAKAIKKIISDLEKAENNDNKDAVKDKTAVNLSANTGNAYRILITYWKSYSNAVHQTHGTYMRALSARAHQAKAICAKALGASFKDAGKSKRNDYRRAAGMDIKEGYVNTDAFLGAVEFI